MQCLIARLCLKTHLFLPLLVTTPSSKLLSELLHTSVTYWQSRQRPGLGFWAGKACAALGPVGQAEPAQSLCLPHADPAAGMFLLLKKSPTSRKAESGFRKDSFLWSHLQQRRDYEKWNFKSTFRHCRLAAAPDKKFHLKIILQTVLPRIKDLHLSELHIFPHLCFFIGLGRLKEACGIC